MQFTGLPIVMFAGSEFLGSNSTAWRELCDMSVLPIFLSLTVVLTLLIVVFFHEVVLMQVKHFI
jgi:hypothetical protein